MVEQSKSKTAAPAPTAVPITPEATNPLSLIASYFGSMLTNGLVTIDFDFDPTRELLVAFSGVQRSSGGYISTGVGYVSPMDNIEAEKGLCCALRWGPSSEREAGWPCRRKRSLMPSSPPLRLCSALRLESE